MVARLQRHQHRILSLCEPGSLFKGFNQNPIKKPIDSGTMEPEVLKC